MLNIPNEIKDILKSSDTRNNLRITFPFDNISDITNDNILSESLEFDESLCSSEFKLGLCEASGIKFDALGVGNIKNKVFDATLEVIVTNAVKGLDGNLFPEGKRKLMKIDSSVEDLGGSDEYYEDVDISRFESEDYFEVEVIAIPYETEYLGTVVEDVSGFVGEEDLADVSIIDGNIVRGFGSGIVDIDSIISTSSFSSGDGSINLEYRLYSFENLNISGLEYRADINKYVYPIKLGRFKVDSCEREATNMSKRTIKAYSFGYNFDNIQDNPFYKSIRGNWWKNNSPIEIPVEVFKDMAVSPTDVAWTSISNIADLPTYTRGSGVEIIQVDTDYGALSPTKLYDSSTTSHTRQFDVISIFARNTEQYKKDIYENVNEAVERLYQQLKEQHPEFDPEKSSLLDIDNIKQYVKTVCNLYIKSTPKSDYFGKDAYGSYKYSGDTQVTADHYEFINDGIMVGASYFEQEGTNYIEDTSSFIFPKSCRITATYDMYSDPIVETIEFDSTLLQLDYKHTSYESIYTSGVSTHLWDRYINGVIESDWSQRDRVPIITIPRTTKVTVPYVSGATTTNVVRYQAPDTMWLDGLGGQEIAENVCEVSGFLGKVNRDGQIESYNVSSTTEFDLPTSLYYKAWYDDEAVEKYQGVSLEYTNTSGQKVTIGGKQKSGFIDLYVEFTPNYYNLSSNSFITGNIFDSISIDYIIENITNTLENFTYRKIDVESKGLPYVEVGDTVNIDTPEGTIKSIILSRHLSGIHGLKDNFESK